ncbi:unnamed protein product [Lampetra fluviatilis]
MCRDEQHHTSPHRTHRTLCTAVVAVSSHHPPRAAPLRHPLLRCHHPDNEGGGGLSPTLPVPPPQLREARSHAWAAWGTGGPGAFASHRGRGRGGRGGGAEAVCRRGDGFTADPDGGGREGFALSPRGRQISDDFCEVAGTAAIGMTELTVTPHAPCVPASHQPGGGYGARGPAIIGRCGGSSEVADTLNVPTTTLRVPRRVTSVAATPGWAIVAGAGAARRPRRRGLWGNVKRKKRELPAPDTVLCERERADSMWQAAAAC